MNITEMREIVTACSYKPGWTIYFDIDDKGNPFMQIGVDETTEASIDSANRKVRVPWRGSKRYLTEYMCRQEIVGAAFGLIKDAESHEMREWFRYKGSSIYNPHLDPDALVEVARWRKNFNVRENAMTMEEVAG